MTPTFFLNNINIHSLPELERYIALMWWQLSINENSDYLSIIDLHESMKLSGYSDSNISRLKNRLTSDKRVSTKENGKLCRLNIKFKPQLDEEYAFAFGSRKVKANLANDLKHLADDIKSKEIKSFIIECVTAYEYKLYRSAVVMSWLAAVAVLKQEVIDKHLNDFNAEACRLDSKWKAAKTTDDLSKMSEANFLDRLENISVIGKNVKTELKACLDRRNSCGHPNTYKIENNTTSHHIETLIMNIFREFPKN